MKLIIVMAVMIAGCGLHGCGLHGSRSKVRVECDTIMLIAGSQIDSVRKSFPDGTKLVSRHVVGNEWLVEVWYPK